MRLISDEALAAVTIVQEAAGEPYEGKLAVANVIRHRMELGVHSDGTVAGTVLRAYQFSGWNTKPDFLRIRTVQADDSEQSVCEALLAWRESATRDLVPGAVMYCNLNVLATPPAWARPELFVATVHRHTFFRGEGV